MKNSIIPIIISGGSGVRLWPLSRAHYPKQFLKLVNHQSLLQETYTRLKNIKNIAAPIIVCQEEYRFLVAEQFREIDTYYQTLILEPALRNTAPAIALAAHWVAQHIHPEVKLLILPADHAMEGGKALADTIERVVDQMQSSQLITFGVKPTHLETAYGYIRANVKEKNNLIPIEEFVEKPNEARAQEYLKSGNYYWNSGIFLFTAQAYLNELKVLAPEIFKFTNEAIFKAQQDQDFVRPEKQAFLNSPAISIDYAVMEKTKNIAMMPLQVKWIDIGSWNALVQHQKKDGQGNVIRGDVVIDEVKNSYIYSENRLVTVGGLENVVVVDTPDALLVMNQSHSQALKNIVNSLTRQKRKEVELPAIVHRPWGIYQTILEEKHFLVKKIVVNAGQKLSLQLHHHRAEHWIVVKGTLTVTNGDKVFDLHRDQSTYIPLAGQHRMANNTQEVVEVIEVQIGDYLAEEDIVRLEDTYGRV